ELLEGLDRGDFLEFQAWCVAEREDVRKLHGRVLRALVERLAGDPEAALPHARTLATIDPLDETARAGLVRLLAAAGRTREAEQQYEAACRLRQELRRTGSAELDAAGRAVREGAALPAAAREPEACSPAEAGSTCGLVGRLEERARLESALEAAAANRGRVLLLTGEPGLGKSRLVAELCCLATARAGTFLEGRAVQAAAGRPVGPRVDPPRPPPPGAGAARPATPRPTRPRPAAGGGGAGAPRRFVGGRGGAAGGSRRERPAARRRARGRALDGRGLGRDAALRRAPEPPPSAADRPHGARGRARR